MSTPQVIPQLAPAAGDVPGTDYYAPAPTAIVTPLPRKPTPAPQLAALDLMFTYYDAA